MDRTLDSGRSLALPSYPNAFVGRSAELDTISRHFYAGVRLVVVRGHGGVGKTRLAVHFGATRAAEVAPSVVFVDLTDARTADAAIGAIVRAMPVPVEPGNSARSILTQVGRWLEAERPLLILDNFEQLADLAEATVGTWLEIAPSARFLVTSRVALALPSEVIADLHPLEVPRDGASGASLEESDAIRLFLARLPPGAVQRGDARDVERIARVVRGVEGFPLAIELAAARLEVLSLSQLHDRMRDPLGLLRNPLDEGRHGAIWNAIDVSWQVLRPFEQRALAQTAVFAGGFTLDAASDVIDLGPIEGSAPPTVLDALHALTRSSLLRVDSSGGPRFDSYFAVREYARQRLDAMGADAAEARHADHYLREAETWAAEVHGPNGATALESLAREHDNLHAVSRRALASPRTAASVDRALRSIAALGAFLALRGSRAEYVARLDAVIEAARELDTPPDPARLGWALQARAMQHVSLGRMDEAASDARQAIELARSSGDRALEAAAFADLGTCLGLQGDAARAREAFDAGLRAGRSSGDRRREAHLLSLVGFAALEAGRYGDAERLLEEALVGFTDTGDRRGEGRVLSNLGTLHVVRRRYAEARAVLERARAAQANVSAREVERVECHLAIVAHLEGRLDDAERGYERAAASFADAGEPHGAAYFHGCLALLAIERGELEVAASVLPKVIDTFRRVRDRRDEGICTAMMAGERALAGRYDEAQTLLVGARTLLGGVGDPVIARLADVYRALLDLCEAETRAAASRDGAELVVACAAARSHVENFRALPSDDAALALRLLSAKLDATEAHARAWRIGKTGLFFQAPQGAVVALDSRPTLARVLAALLARRLERPGQVLTQDEILNAGWNEERILRSAGANRVRVAMSTLRKLGLEQLLVREPSGYLLDAAVAIDSVEE